MDRRKNPGMVAAVWVFLAVLAGPAARVTVPSCRCTIYVDPNGWADFNSIQAAIDDANDYDEIVVAQGTYYEAINFKGKAVYLYSSGGPDVTTIDANGAHHAVQCVSGEDANTILEGFTITGGDADGPGGLEDYHGGGMYNWQSSPTVTNCTFSGNSADQWGGGMYNWQSSPTVTNCTFSDNSAYQWGGGMNNYEYSSPAVSNCTFIGNSAQGGGGGMYNLYNANPTVANCTFSGNSPANEGGGMYNFESSPTVTNCIFTDNSGGWEGGGMYNFFGSPAVTNCKFTENNADGGGGGMYNNDSSPTVTNCTFWGNTAWFEGGGGMYNYQGSPTVTNCILWEDWPDEIYGSAIVTYSDVQWGWSGAGGYNIDADPLFVDASGGDLRLLSDSPCIDAGDNNSVASDTADLDNDGNTTEPIPFGLNGGPRLWDGDGDGNDVVDMGALEYGELRVHNRTQNASYISIQRAINEANNGDEIEVEPGTSKEQTIDFKGKAIRLYSRCGPAVTTIDGRGNYRVIQCVSGENANTVLEGFTITGGNAVSGGGMYNSGSSPRVTNCRFSGNEAIEGAGMNNMNSRPTVINCTFSGNSAAQWGGGMYNSGDSPVVTNCTFAGNQAVSGGGMYNHLNNPTVTNCILWGDTPDEIYNDGSNPIVTYSDVQGGTGQSWFGRRCIDLDPWFMDTSNPDQNLWNLRLKAYSACIDAGDTTALPGGIWVDLGGEPRVSDDPQTWDTGLSVSGATVDMGAYEFQPCRIAGDINCDGVVDFKDMAILAGNWLADTEVE